MARGVRAEPPPAIVLAFDARSEAEKQAVGAIQAHMSGLPLRVVLAPVERQQTLELRLAASGALAASRHALGTFYIEIADDRSLLIFFTQAEGEATLIRRLSRNEGGVRVAFEQAAIVVRSLVEALLDGGSVGIARPDGADGTVNAGEAGGEFEPSPNESAADDAGPSSPQGPKTGDLPRSDLPVSGAEEPPSDAKRGEPRFALAAGGVVTPFAAGVPAHTGLSAGLQWRALPVLYVGARYTFFPALTLEDPDATLSVKRHPLEALVGYRQGGPLGLNAEVGVQADRVTRTTVRTSASLAATGPEARWLLALGARGGFSWSPWSPLWVSMRVGADFLLTSYGYAIEGSKALPSPLRVRPRLELELSVWVW